MFIRPALRVLDGTPRSAIPDLGNPPADGAQRAVSWLSLHHGWFLRCVGDISGDVSIALGAISLFSIDVNLDVLAALLTILGYSLNDTIIVFDRIREGITDSKETVLPKVIDESVTRTLSRTTLTSLTTFFVVLTLYVFGGEILVYRCISRIAILIGHAHDYAGEAHAQSICNVGMQDSANPMLQRCKALLNVALKPMVQVRDARDRRVTT